MVDLKKIFHDFIQNNPQAFFTTRYLTEMCAQKTASMFFLHRCIYNNQPGAFLTLYIFLSEIPWSELEHKNLKKYQLVQK